MNAAAAFFLVLQLGLGPACDLVHQQLFPILGDLFAKSRSAAKDAERALFLTRDEHGNLGYELWPATYERRKASFIGAIPPNTVGIAHTHPTGMPQASSHDINESARIGLPIFVVTRTSIERVDPDHSTQRIVGNKDWIRAMKRGGDVCSVLS
ncbi:MAG: hypothetical protein ACTHQM_07625 [Thermoanaerobaculia bacterium]